MAVSTGAGAGAGAGANADAHRLRPHLRSLDVTQAADDDAPLPPTPDARCGQRHVRAHQQSPCVSHPCCPPATLPLLPRLDTNAQDDKYNDLSEQLDKYWKDTKAAVEALLATPATFKSYQLPLARVKKVMKTEPSSQVRRTAAVTVLFSSAAHGDNPDKNTTCPAERDDCSRQPNDAGKSCRVSD